MSETTGVPATAGESDTSQNPSTDVENAESQTEQSQSKPVSAAEIRKYKLKVNGAQKEYDQNTILAFAQKGMGADQKFQQAALERKKVERLVKLAKEDPDSLLRELTGEDPQEIYTKRLSKKLQEMSMDPKEKKIRDYEAKLAEFEKKQAQRKEQESKEKQDKAVEFWTQKYDKELPEALKSAGLPMTPQVISMAADVLIGFLEQDIDIDMADAIQIVKDKHISSVKNFLTGAQKEKLIDLLGQDLVEGIIAAKQKKSQKAAPKVQITPPSQQNKAKSLKTQKDALKELDERINGWKQG